MIDGRIYISEDKSITLGKNESCPIIDTPLFRYSLTYRGYCSQLSNHVSMQTTIEMPIMTGLLKRVFGEKVGNWMGKFELPVTDENSSSMYWSGYYLQEKHPNFLKLLER